MSDLADRIARLAPEKRAQLEARLAERLSGRAAPPPIPRRAEAGPCALSFAQERLWFLDQLEPGPPVYNVVSAFRLAGTLDADAFGVALSAVVARHEALRTTFRSVDGTPQRVVALETAVTLAQADWAGLAEGEVRRRLEEEARRPFDLSRDPLLRATLARLSPQEHILLLVVHHIAADGWSVGILCRELGELYAARRAGREPGLPELPIQYADFALWQRQWLEGEVLERQLAYWKRQLADSAPLEFPVDHPRPRVPTQRGARLAVEVPAELCDALRALSRREGASLFMILLAAFQVLLHRYTGREDIAVGTPVAGRTRLETEGLIGFFVNTLVLRADLGSDLTFRETLARVRDTALDAYAHQDVPFERLVEALHLERSLSLTPLFQVMFGFHNALPRKLELPGVEVSRLEINTGTAKFDLALALEEAATGLRGFLEYSLDLFEADTAGRLWGHYVTLLEAAARNPDERIRRLPLMREPERRQILVEWNDTKRPYPQACLHELFEAQAARRPDAVAVVFGDQQLTYGELNRQANQLAHYLRGLGVGPEVPVALMVQRSPEMVAGTLGILKAGGACLPLDPDYPTERLEFMIEQAAAPVVLTQEALRERLPRCGGEVLCLDAFWETHAGLPAENPGGGGAGDGLAYVMFTSGSTGQPKGVEVTHRGIVRLLFGQDYLELGETETVLHVSAPCFDGAIWELWSALAHGGRCVLFPGRVPTASELGRLLAAHRVTTVNMSTALFHALIDEAGEVFSGVRQLQVGGDVLSLAHARGALRLLPHTRLINSYGPAESTVLTSCYPLPRDLGEDVTSVPIGRPLASTEVYVLDRHLEPVPVGVPGELCVGGDGLARGYLHRPDLTAERFIPHPFSQEAGARLYRTGDLVRWLPDGNLEFLGRLDQQVKIRGYRVEPGEIEVVLEAHPGVRQAVVVAREDRPADKRLVAYVVARQRGELAAGELREHLQHKLPEFMVPSAFVLLEALPLNPNGKVDRRALPAPGPEKGVRASAGPRTPVEEILCGIWAELLGREPVGIHDDFFALGGHSLLALRVIARVHAAFQVDLPVRRFFETPTVAALALAITQLKAVPAESSIPRRQGDAPCRLSSAQERLWFLDQFYPASPLYNVAVVFRLEGALDRGALARALDGVVARHEALRTVFQVSDGVPLQVALPPRPVELREVELPRPREGDELARLLRTEARHPFDLAGDLMLRATLLRLAAEEHILLLGIHHIASDGWSAGILYRELSELYAAARDGRAPRLPELPIQYADFALWQRRRLEDEDLSPQLAYWTRRLAGLRPLDLPADRPRPRVQSDRGSCLPVEWPEELCAALRTLGRQEGATLFMILLAAFQALLFRYTGQEDLAVGAPIAGRGQVETEGLVGFFVNTLVLRTNLGGDPSFRELLARARATAIEAFAHQELPFEKLVEALAPQRSLGHTPLFQVMLGLQNAPSASLELPGLKVSPVEVDLGTAKFDLTLLLEESGSRLAGTISYSTDLFEAATVRRLLGHFRTLLEAAVRQPDERISRLPLMTEPERRQLLVEWNGARRPGCPACVHERFEAQAARAPEAVAAEWEGRPLTYAKLNRRANQLAHHLRGLGVGPEVPVGIMLGRSPDMLVAVLGVLKAGGVCVPLDPAYPEERLAFMAEDAAISLLVTEARLERRAPLAGARALRLDADRRLIARSSPENPAPWATPDCAAYVLYTSGSTGRPKGVVMCHGALANLIEWQLGDLRPGARVLQFAPLSFDVSFQEIFSTLCSGGTLVLLSDELRRDPTALWRLIARQGIERLFVPSVALQQLAEAARSSGPAPARLREIITAGEQLRITPAVTTLFRRLPGCALWNHYGPTESHVVTAHRLEGPPQEWPALPPIGRPIANARIYVLEASLEPVPVGVPGELHIGGGCLARGYLNRPELTAERFIRDPFSDEPGARLYKTGDRARWRADGGLEFLGRLDEQVKIRGFRVEPGEVEAVLAAHPRVKAVAVVAREDAPGDRRLVAYVAPKQDERLESTELRRFLGRKLPEFMLPAVFVVLDELPLLPSGKVNRRALPPPQETVGPHLAAPRDEVESQLASVWEAVLGVRPVGAHDDFFELGGHSLTAVRLVARIEQVMGQRLPVAAVFQAPTVERMAAVLRGDSRVAASARVVPVQPAGSRPPFLCLYSQNILRNLSQSLGPDQPLWGLRLADSDELSSPVRLEDIAAHFVQAVKEAQPEGPHFLGGWCLAGVLAYEVARQLEAQGERVGLVALFDAASPALLKRISGARGLRARLGSPARRLRHGATALRRRSPAARWRYLEGWARGIWLAFLAKVWRWAQRVCPAVSRSIERRLRPTDNILVLAAQDYQPGPCAGRVALFRAALRPAGPSLDPQLGWGGLASGGLETLEVPGDHESMFTGPNVVVLGEKLRACLAAAQEAGRES